MTPVLAGALAGLLAFCGAALLASWSRRRRTGLIDRLAPYVRERPRTSGLLGDPAPVTDARTVSRSMLSAIVSLGSVLERFGSSTDSVRDRLERCGGRMSYEELRVEQLMWAATGIGVSVGLSLLLVMTARPSVPVLALGVVIATLSGAAARDWWLTRQVELRRRRIDAQLPDVVELLALVVGAGQGPVAALERVVSMGRGELIEELAATLAEVRAGTVLTTALRHLDDRVASLQITRLCEAVAVALERGTPLAEVLRAQAADAREASRRALMEEGGRREIAQMIPVVFLVLPITVVFALFPGLFVLRIGL